MDQELVHILNSELSIELPEKISMEEMIDLLARQVHHYIQTDFQRLVNLLYRVDVNETRLTRLLKENTDADAGRLIAELIIERQLEKINSRRQTPKQKNDLGENEKW